MAGSESGIFLSRLKEERRISWERLASSVCTAGGSCVASTSRFSFICTSIPVYMRLVRIYFTNLLFQMPLPSSKLPSRP